MVSLVDIEDVRSCSYAALARLEESKEKLFVWCLKVWAGRRGGLENMIPGVLRVATRAATRGVRLDVGRRSGELE